MYSGKTLEGKLQPLATSIIAVQVPDDRPMIMDAPTPTRNEDALTPHDITAITEADLEHLMRVMGELDAKGIRQAVVTKSYGGTTTDATEKVAVTGLILNIFGQANSPLSSATWAYRNAPGESFKESMKKGGTPDENVVAMLKVRDALYDKAIRPYLSAADPSFITALADIVPITGQFIITGETTPADFALAENPASFPSYLRLKPTEN